MKRHTLTQSQHLLASRLCFLLPRTATVIEGKNRNQPGNSLSLCLPENKWMNNWKEARSLLQTIIYPCTNRGCPSPKKIQCMACVGWVKIFDGTVECCLPQWVICLSQLGMHWNISTFSREKCQGESRCVFSDLSKRSIVQTVPVGPMEMVSIRNYRVLKKKCWSDGPAVRNRHQLSVLFGGETGHARKK